MKKIVVASLIAISAMSTAFAASVTAQSGIYVGGGAGWSNPSAPGFSDITHPSGNYDYGASNMNTYVLQGMVGYNYAFTSNWMAGVEASYLYMGQNTYHATNTILNVSGNQSLTNSGVQLMATGTYLASNGFNGFAKMGAVYETTANSGSLSQAIDYSLPCGNASQSAWLPALAVGAGYMPIQNLNIALQYEHIFGDNWSSSVPSKPMTVELLTLGVTYTLPL